MNYIKQHIIPIVITFLISFLGYVLLSIFSEILPVLLPPLNKLPVTLFLKVILLLITITIVMGLIIGIIISRSKPSKPRTDKGKFYNINWSAEIEYRKGREFTDINTHISWFCPKHKIPLSLIQANVPNKVVHTLYCDRCKQNHDITNKDTTIYLEEAEKIIRRQILNKINIDV